MSQDNKLSYKDSGVDIEKGDNLVDWIKDQSQEDEPHQERILGGIGGFGALFSAKFTEMQDPYLVSCTDGVGTKLLLAEELGAYEEVAQDLVAMCLNDLLCAGAKPLFFLDYYACGQLNLEKAKAFLTGVKKACHSCDCALIGGETAEMPGVYRPESFDCAGFSVGVVDRSKVKNPNSVPEGARLIGLKSSGFHSNGYSLVRKLFADDLNVWGAKLIKPTKLYYPYIKDYLGHDELYSMSHITGGGMDNILRSLPKGFSAELKAWEWPELFLEAEKRSGLTREELLKTFNCGVGFILIVSPVLFDELWEKLPENERLDLGVVVNDGKGQWRL